MRLSSKGIVATPISPDPWTYANIEIGGIPHGRAESRVRCLLEREGGG